MQNSTKNAPKVSPTVTKVSMICFICRQYPRNHQEVLEINEYGYHLTCDHVMADVYDQQKVEVKEME